MTQNKKVVETFHTPAFRLSYPVLFQPKPVMGNDSKLQYSITMLFPKAETVQALKNANHPTSRWLDDQNLNGFKQAMIRVARGNFGPEVDLQSLKFPKLRDGNKPKPVSQKIDDNEKGYIVVRTTSNSKPQVIRQDKTYIPEEKADEVYPGCWVRAVISISSFTHKVGGRGVALYFAGIQKLADDTAFSSRPRIEDEFDAVVEDPEADVTDTPAQTPTPGADPWDL